MYKSFLYIYGQICTSYRVLHLCVYFAHPSGYRTTIRNFLITLVKNNRLGVSMNEGDPLAHRGEGYKRRVLYQEREVESSALRSRDQKYNAHEGREYDCIDSYLLSLPSCV